MLNTKAYYRQQAAQCRQEAEKAADAKVRRELIEIAERYERLANRARDDDKPGG